MPDAVVMSQGDEVVTGQITDTNAAWLSQRLTERGVRVVHHVTVGDRLPHLVEAFGASIARAPIVMCTGGLGPTVDDLTAEAVARLTGRPLTLDPVALAAIQHRYDLAGRDMPASNRKQALLPEGAERLDNHEGTAPGFALSLGRSWIACLPGVPHEMRAMFQAAVAPRLATRFALEVAPFVTLRIAGLGESAIQDRLDGIAFPAGLVPSLRATPQHVELKLRAPAGLDPEALRALVAHLGARLGRAVFSVAYAGADSAAVATSLAEVVGAALTARGETLAIAESCTGGQLGAACTAVPGASAWFTESLVTYANTAKVRHLGVPSSLLDTHGAVSEPVARAMAEGVRRAAGAAWGIGVTGIAGPGGGTPDKPVGTVHVAVSGPSAGGAMHTAHRLLRLPGDRARVQVRAVASALDLLRRALEDASDPARSSAPSTPASSASPSAPLSDNPSIPRRGTRPAQPPRS